MSWLLAIAGFALLIVLHEAGHFAAAKLTGMRVERFFLFFPPKIVGITRGETEYGIGAIPLGGFVKITGMNPDEKLEPGVAARGYYAQPVWKRIVVIAAGPAVNIVLALAIFFALAVGFGLDEPENRVGDVRSSLPAGGKLEPGDRILSVDGTRVADLPAGDLQLRVAELVNRHPCRGPLEDGCRAARPVTLRVERDGRVRTLSARPEFDAAVPGLEGDEPGRMLLGFGYEQRRVRESLGGGIEFSLDRSWFIVSRTIGVFARILDAEQREQITGVVGATEVTRQSFEFDTRQAIGVLGVISLSLGLINLFPFLPLDGGHIFWSLVEKLRGRRVSVAVMERSGAIGFVLVAMLFLIGLTNDIDRLANGGFDVR